MPDRGLVLIYMCIGESVSNHHGPLAPLPGPKPGSLSNVAQNQVGEGLGAENKERRGHHCLQVALLLQLEMGLLFQLPGSQSREVALQPRGGHHGCSVVSEARGGLTIAPSKF